MNASGYFAIVMMLFACLRGSAQVSSNKPKVWKIASSMRVNIRDDKLRETVYQEIFQTELASLISKSINLTDHERELFQIAPSWGDCLAAYKLTNEWTPTCELFKKRVEAYMDARLSGHTVECLFTGLTNRPAAVTNSDPDLAILCTNFPFLSPTWFKKAESGTKTNKAGQVMWEVRSQKEENGQVTKANYSHAPKTDEVCRWVTYTLSDGGLGWRYYMSFKPDGALERLYTTKFDGKDIDPQFQKIMKEVDAEIAEEMKGMPRQQLGAVHVYWSLKKSKLKARGIEWRSPADVNPGVIYD